ncbi:MAG: DoxX family membrane protein [Candidatus Sumerlaeota bacterium]|nr:DoxX family membrane protein [Candidatus Sumerlaeota bacterium]
MKGIFRMSHPLWRWALLALRLGIGAVFLYSGYVKIHRPFDFLSSVYDYQLLGRQSGLLLAIWLPWMEVVLGFFLVSGAFAGGAFLGSALLGWLFVLAQVAVLFRGLSVSCGCFGDMDFIGKRTLARAGVLAIGSILGFVLCMFRRPDGRIGVNSRDH